MIFSLFYFLPLFSIFHFLSFRRHLDFRNHCIHCIGGIHVRSHRVTYAHLDSIFTFLLLVFFKLLYCFPTDLSGKQSLLLILLISLLNSCILTPSLSVHYLSLTHSSVSLLCSLFSTFPLSPRFSLSATHSSPYYPPFPPIIDSLFILQGFLYFSYNFYGLAKEMFFLPVVWWLIAIVPIGSGMLEMTVRLVSTHRTCCAFVSIMILISFLE